MSLTPRLTPTQVIAAASRALGRTAVDAVRHPVGWGNENWGVRVGSGEQFIVKCGPSDLAAKWAATTSAYVRAHEAGVPVPRLERFEASSPELDGAVMRIFEWKTESHLNAYWLEPANGNVSSPSWVQRFGPFMQ